MTPTAQTEQGAREVVIVGGGTAGWMAAAGLVSLFGETARVTLIESEAIGIVGVGEATLPHLKAFNDTIGLSEARFVPATRATIKLGIEFCDWGRLGDRYIHPFGEYGIDNDGVPFHQLWRRAGAAAGRIDDYSLPVLMAELDRFAPPTDDLRAATATYRYAYQLDATAYAPLLRAHAEARGARRIEGRVVRAERDERGDVARLHLDDGHTVAGDLFLDCSGFTGLLTHGALETPWEDWSRWLPCDRAVAVACAHEGPLQPYTRATAREAGWQWRIPLQHRTGNGHVYCSSFLDDQAAEDRLMGSLEGDALADPRPLRFATGKRARLWHRNVVAIGLAGGFLEPLESTSIYLIQQGITHLIETLPADRDWAAARDEYNRVMDREFARIRDFLILHYHATERDDTPFWNEMRTMVVPDSLAEKIALFRRRGRIQGYDHGLFLEASWLAVFLGQRVTPEAHDPRAEEVPLPELTERLTGLRAHLRRTAEAMPTHADWLGGQNLTVAAAAA